MDATGILRIVLYVALIVLAGVGVWGVVEVVGAARSMRRLSEDLNANVPPLIERANATLDTINTELRRVDGVVSQLEEVSGRVNTTTRAAQEIVEAPAMAVSGLAEGVRSFFSVLTGRRL
ncbi:MAG: hypothetical protein Q7W30_09950 [Coriobacteriia bacterium]|nr:hypothetical protein [Coriobacteriia bacterium]